MFQKILPILFSLALISPSFATEIPSDDASATLVSDTLLAFNGAVKNDDFTDFRETMAKRAQDQLSAEKLKTSFQEFVEKKIDLSAIEELEPAFGSKEIDENGVLVLTGSYPTTPVVVQFTLKYLQENGDWKLIGISLDTKTESPAAQKKESDAQEKEGD